MDSITTLVAEARGARQHAAAKDAALRNRVANAPLVLADRDIQLGRGAQAATNSRFGFTPGGAQMNAVRVTGRRTTGSSGGPVALFLGRVMGVGQFQPQHVATSTQLDRDICLVVDRSGSMMESLTGGNVPGGACNPPHPTRSRWGALNTGILPVTIGSETSVTDPNLTSVLDGRAKADYVQLYLDQATTPELGAVINDAVATLFAQTGSPDQVTQTITSAASGG